MKHSKYISRIYEGYKEEGFFFFSLTKKKSGFPLILNANWRIAVKLGETNQILVFSSRIQAAIPQDNMGEEVMKDEEEEEEEDRVNFKPRWSYIYIKHSGEVEQTS